MAICLGEAFRAALGSKKGIERYSFVLPMDDCLAQVAVDLGGRPWLVWEVDFKSEKLGEMPTEMFFHFFKSFSDNAKCNLNIKAEGDNEHHRIEAVFKAFARTMRTAVKKTDNFKMPSTKGKL
jgi:imidazoleglycerol-phosphate dehydratase/histidinol-phosphatase